MSILNELKSFNIETTLKEHFNLSANPFTPQELFYEGISEPEAQKHDVIFQDRRELLQQLLISIQGQASCKAVLFGDRGVGKSSLMNLILFSLARERYLTMKISITQEDVESELLHKKILRELATTLIANIIETTGTNWEGVKTRIRALFKRKAMNQLEVVSTLSFLFSGDQVSFEETAAEKTGETFRLGPQALGFSTASEEVHAARALISYSRIPPRDFRRLLGSAYGAVQEFGYQGIVLALDDADKLDDLQLEQALLRLLKDAFYPEARYHLLVACARDIIEARARNLFTYHFVDVLPRNDLMAALDQMYRAFALSPGSIFDYFDQDCLDEIYTHSQGLLRDAILACQEALTTACIEGKSKVDLDALRHIQVPDELAAKLELLDRQSTEWRVLGYLRDRGESYASDPDLQRATQVTQSRLSQILKALEQEQVLVSRRQGKQKMYELRSGIHRLLR